MQRVWLKSVKLFTGPDLGKPSEVFIIQYFLTFSLKYNINAKL